MQCTDVSHLWPALSKNAFLLVESSEKGWMLVRNVDSVYPWCSTGITWSFCFESNSCHFLFLFIHISDDHWSDGSINIWYTCIMYQEWIANEWKRKVQLYEQHCPHLGIITQCNKWFTCILLNTLTVIIMRVHSFDRFKCLTFIFHFYQSNAEHKTKKIVWLIAVNLD